MSLVAGLVLYFIVRYEINEYKRFLKDFSILKHEDKIEAVVNKIHKPQNTEITPSVIYVSFGNGKKYMIKTERFNQAENRNIFNVLNTGDKLFKSSFSDSLYLLKETEMGYTDSMMFILQK